MRINPRSTLKVSKNMSIRQNVSFRVLDERTGEVIQEHTGHNSATNSLIFGIAHHLIGDFVPNEGVGLHPGYEMLANYVPRYISLGTMGLLNQEQDAYGLPAGIGDMLPDISDPEYAALIEELNAAKAELDAAEEAYANRCPYYPATEECKSCTYCADLIETKKQAVEDAKIRYNAAYAAAMQYNEEARFVDYMLHRPGYGADGYDMNENNDRPYFGLGYAFSGYDVTRTYTINDTTTYNGIVYTCIANTPTPAGSFDSTKWKALPDQQQPSLGTTTKLELISPSFPRELIAYRDVIPEYEAEIPKTIDVVFSAMISTGALKQFRPKDSDGNAQDYIFITEAGLWSRQSWDMTGENGLLAGYRIVPPNPDNWDMTDPSNREILKRQILKVGKNQVVQVIWKIQIGAVDEFPESKVETGDLVLVGSEGYTVVGSNGSAIIGG